MIGNLPLNVRMQHVVGLGIAGVLLALVGEFVRLRSKITLDFPHAEAAFVVILSAFPVLAYLLAKYVTHFAAPHYVQPAIIGIVGMLAIFTAPLLENKTITRIVFASLFVAIAMAGFFRIRHEMEQGRGTMLSLALNPETERNLESVPKQPIYVMNSTVFQLVGYYAPNADIRSRITLVYPRDAESLDIGMQAVYQRAAGIRNIVPFESVFNQGTEHLLLLYHNPWDYTDHALSESHAQIKYLGQFFGGDLVLVRFP
jgi:hypothetical protein